MWNKHPVTFEVTGYLFLQDQARPAFDRRMSIQNGPILGGGQRSGERIICCALRIQIPG
jgi:hypothetical protein